MRKVGVVRLGAADLVSEAQHTAGRLLGPLGRRWIHVQAVAATAKELASTVQRDDHPLLVAAAWLHDIGYAPELHDTGLHSVDGARYLRASGWPDRVVNLVAHHSGARFEAVERGLDAELAEFDLEDSPAMDALIAADLTTGPNGERLSYAERIAEILGRYPPADPVHRAWLHAADPLQDAVQRVRWRQAAS